MNCRTCGTPLPPGAAYCPRGGAATSFSPAETAVAPDDCVIVRGDGPTAEPVWFTCL
jgi:hypothetical protein